jgi:CrcB protein
LNRLKTAPRLPSPEPPVEDDVHPAERLIFPEEAVPATAWQERELARNAISDQWRQRSTTFAAIGCGGFLGANARYSVGLWAAATWGAAFPWGTLLINLVGSFVLGLFLALVTERFSGRPTTRLFLATGFLGAFTTFSTFSYETVQLLARGATIAALAYVAGSLLLGLAAAVVGLLCAHAL